MVRPRVRPRVRHVFQRRDQRTYGQVRASHALAAPYPFVLYSGFRLSVRVHAPPGGPCRPCTLYEDDGETFAFEKGQGNRLELRWDPHAGPRAERRGDWPGRRYEIVEWC